ncbi:hypothetical protein ACJIZ3_013251 [Penstemon smallii]|uniref:GDSL esterase/lipase n=1 Tax=Penstemon smallii TaxID=265156 RepID=A0ABD3UPD9_9LAMI
MFFIKTMCVVITSIYLMMTYARATNYHNTSCILVFGDSSVDPGNNNWLSTPAKSNFLPYGKDFFNGQPSGRFCNGRLATDFIAEKLGYINLIKAFLDPNITKKDILHGVSFASADSGYDEYTANLTNVISLTKQLEYLRHYKIKLRALVGTKQSEEIIQKALFLLSMGTNDFLQNYYVETTRPKQYNIEQYQNYLISCMLSAIKAMHKLGARKLVVVGVPPFGCIPLVRTLRDDVKCDLQLNNLALSFNSKIQRALKNLKGSSIGIVFVDINSIILNAIENPRKYGFTEPLKGCCGSGTYEYGPTCKDLNTCPDRTKYIFWDAVHLTESMYKIIAEKALEFFGNMF